VNSQINTERVLLASMLEFPESLHSASALGLLPEHFSRKNYRLLFREILKLGQEGQPIAFETLLRGVLNNPESNELSAALEDLTDPLHIPRKDIEWHVNQLKDASRRARINAICKRTAAATEDFGEATNDCLNYLQESLLEVQADSASGQATHIKAFMPEALRELELQSLQKGLLGLPTGIPDLDEATTGVRAGELWVVGGLPGRGKSILGAQIGLANASAGNSVVFLSMEMRRNELVCRFLSNETNVSASRIRKPAFIKKEQWVELANRAAEISEWPLYIDDSPTLSLHELIGRARLCIRRYNCRLIIVDYIGHIKAPGREIREQVGNAIDGLRQLAKNEQVGVVALSQLARPKDRNLTRVPIC